MVIYQYFCWWFISAKQGSMSFAIFSLAALQAAIALICALCCSPVNSP